MLKKVVKLSKKVEALEKENKKLREVIRLQKKLDKLNKEKVSKLREMVLLAFDQYTKE